MRNLALRYYVCKKNAPNEGVRGDVEELFEEDTKYDEIFDESAINKDLFDNHVVINYVTCWSIHQILQKVDLPKRDDEYFQYTKWFVLTEIYRRLKEWKQRKFNLGWQIWINFIESHQFEKAVFDYSRPAFRVGRKIIPMREEARSFFKTKDAVKKFSSNMSKRKFESLLNNVFNKFKKVLTNDSLLYSQGYLSFLWSKYGFL